MNQHAQHQLRALIQRLTLYRQQDTSLSDPALEDLLAELTQALDALTNPAPTRPARPRTRPLQQADFLETDQTGQLVDVSPGLARLFGTEREAMLGRSVLDLLSPDAYDSIRNHLDTAAEDGLLQIWELDLQPPGRPTLPYLAIIRLLDDEQDQLHIHWQVFDMAGTEESGMYCDLLCLRSSLLDNLPGMAYRCLNEPNYTMLYVNEGCRALTGYAPADLLNNQTCAFVDLIFEADQTRIWKAIQTAAAHKGNYQFTYRIRTAQGEEKWVWEQGHLTENTHQGIPVLEGFITDITAQFEIENILVQRTEDISLLYEASTQLSQSLDPDTLYETLYAIVSRKLDCAGLFISDYDPDTELITCAFAWGKAGRVDVSDFPSLPLNTEGQGTQSLVIRTGEALNIPDFPAQARTSRTRYYVDDAGQLTGFNSTEELGDDIPQSALIIPLKREGQVVGVLQVFSDRPAAYNEDDLHFVEALSPMYEAVAANVELYQRAQQEIAERTAAEEAVRFQALLLDSISQAVIATDLEGRVTYWNHYATTLYGWSEEEALGAHIYTLIAAGDLAEAQAIMGQLARGESWSGEHLARRKDDTRFPSYTTGSPILDSAGKQIGVLGVSWDITERKFTEEILENQARQMALINQVGGQINGVLGLDNALNRAAQLVQSTFNYQHVGLFLLDKDGRRITMRARDGVYAFRFPENHALAIGEGIVGWVAEEGRRLLANDVNQEEHYRNPFADKTIQSELAVPIQIGGEILGVLDVQSQDLNAFDQTDVLVLETLADQLAVAIQNARLYEAERHQRELAEASSKLAAILSSTLEPDEVLERILSHVSQVLPHDAANIFVMEGEQGHYVCWQGYPPEMVVHMQRRVLSSNTNALLQAMTQGEIILLPETQGSALWPPNPALAWIRSHLGVPIRYKGKVFGYLSLDSAIPNHFTPEDALHLQAIADQAAMAIQNAHLYQAEREQRHMAETLREMAAIMSSTLEMEGILPHVLPYVERFIPHDASNIMLIERDKVRFVEWRGTPPVENVDLATHRVAMESFPLLKRIAAGESILIPDVQDSPDWKYTPRTEKVRSYVSVPIRSQQVVFGSLNLESRTPNHFTKTDVIRLQAVADQVAIAMRNAHLYQSEREQRRMAEALRDLAAILSGSLEQEEILKRMLEQIGRVIKHDAAVLRLIENGTARLAYWHGFSPSDGTYLQSLQLSLDLSDFRQMLTTGEPVIIRDTTAYPDWAGGPSITWIRCQLSVPIRYQGTVIGFLSLVNAEPDSFTLRDADHLQTIADQAAVAIQNARLYQAEREQHRLTEALRDMAASISGTLSIDELLQRLLENVGRVVPHDRGNIMLISGNTIEVAYVHGYDEDTESALKIRFPLETPNLHHILETGEPFIIQDTRDYDGWVQAPETMDVQSYVGVPIQARSAVIGFLNLDSYTPNFFTYEHAENLMAFVHQASVAIQNARLYQDLEMYSESLELAVRERTVELNRSRERVEAILNGSNDAIIFLDSDGMIRQGNPAFNALFGYGVDEAFGHPLTDLAPEDQWPQLVEALQLSSEETLPGRVEIMARRKDGTQFDIDMALSPVRSGDVLIGLVCSLRDITARKASEKALKDALEKERELGQLKSRFVSMASHEFRTPLTTILSSSFLLENRYDRMTEEQKSRHFQKIKASIQHMNQLLEDVLTIGTAEAGRLQFNPEPLNLSTLCREATEEAQLGTQTRVHMNFSTERENCQVVMDGKLLRQILDNLLSNAIKYSPQGGTVHIDVHCGQRETTIQVQDEGIGIPEADQKHLFDPFHRGGNVAGIQGTGLGLAITKRSVDLHQGSLTFSSQENVGTTFTVILPNKPPNLDTDD